MSERMTLAQIKAHNARIASGKRLVKASDFERRPPSLAAPALGSPKPHVATKGQETGARAGIGPERVLRLVLTGEILGAGKNNLMVCRNGRRVAPERFKVWSRDAIGQILAQVSKIADRPHGCFFTGPVAVLLLYVRGDFRRRDMPAVIDGLWHVLEKAQIVADDSQLWITWSRREYNHNAPRVEMTLREEATR